MATTISISTGALSASRTYQNDAAAQAILLRFAANIDATGTNAQKLQAIVDWCVAQIQAGATSQEVVGQQTQMIEDAKANNRLA